MSTRSGKLLAGIVVLTVAIGIVWGMFQLASQSAKQDIVENSGVWTCSMHPQIRLNHPGRCPICGMALIPVAQLTAEKAKRSSHRLLETEAVTRRALFKAIRTVGKFDYNERRIAYISARVTGRVDRVYADFTGVQVKPGDHLVDIYSPDLYSAQAELLLALDASKVRPNMTTNLDRSFPAQDLDSSRRKLTLLGLLPEQIAEIETTHKTRTHLTIYAPIGGTVIEKEIREGQYVKDGDPLFRIADLDPIWLYLNVYEYDVAWLRHGQKVDVTLQGYGGETLQGMVTFIDPFLDDATRTIKVRVNLPNRDRHIKPQMYATAVIHVPLRADGRPQPTGMEGKYFCPMHLEVIKDQPGKCPICGMTLERFPGEPLPTNQPANPEQSPQPAGMLAVPVTAVLDTGRRKIAYRHDDKSGYELVELTLGPRVETADEQGRPRGYYPVLDGLKEGDRVVVQSGFLLDSQRQIEGMPSLLYPEGSTATSQLHAGHSGVAQPQPPGKQSPATMPVHKH